MPSVAIAGLESRGLVLEAPLLQREGCLIREASSARELLRILRHDGIRLIVLGSQLTDQSLPSLVQHIRTAAETRAVSILVLIPTNEPDDLAAEVLQAGANAALRRPLEPLQLEAWLAKLLTVARRVEVRIPVDGQVVGSPRELSAGHFYAVARNLSVHGLLLASPLRLEDGTDLELDLRLVDARGPVKALGRVVREAPDVRWPYLGYGIEFLYVPETSVEIIDAVVRRGFAEVGQPVGGVHSTLRRGGWVYEVLQPAPALEGWQVEIRRAQEAHWRVGVAGPFFVVSAATPTEALVRAREFLAQHA